MLHNYVEKKNDVLKYLYLIERKIIICIWDCELVNKYIGNTFHSYFVYDTGC